MMAQDLNLQASQPMRAKSMKNGFLADFMVLFCNRFSHRHKLFRCRRMNADCRIENRLSGAGAQGYGEALHNFGGIGADHMHADDLIVIASDNQLHKAFMVKAG
jgi:hypothetical protein